MTTVPDALARVVADLLPALSFGQLALPSEVSRQTIAPEAGFRVRQLAVAEETGLNLAPRDLAEKACVGEGLH